MEALRRKVVCPKCGREHEVPEVEGFAAIPCGDHDLVVFIKKGMVRSVKAVPRVEGLPPLGRLRLKEGAEKYAPTVVDLDRVRAVLEGRAEPTERDLHAISILHKLGLLEVVE